MSGQSGLVWSDLQNLEDSRYTVQGLSRLEKVHWLEEVLQHESIKVSIRTTQRRFHFMLPVFKHVMFKHREQLPQARRSGNCATLTVLMSCGICVFLCNARYAAQQSALGVSYIQHTFTLSPARKFIKLFTSCNTMYSCLSLPALLHSNSCRRIVLG